MAKPTKIRTLRHWKQRFDPNAKMVFRKRVVWGGEEDTVFMPGEDVPEDLLSPHRLRTWWEAGIIELAEFETPNVLTGQVDEEDSSRASDETTEDETTEDESGKEARAKKRRQRRANRERS